MLKEYVGVSQKEGDPGKRRWWTGVRLELIIWSQEDHPVGFQLCLDGSHALTWKNGEGESYTAIDDGDVSRKKMTPILVPNGPCPRDELIMIFEVEGKELEENIYQFVLEKLNEKE